MDKGSKSTINIFALDMRITHLIFLLNFLIFLSCKKQSFTLTTIEGKLIEINDSIPKKNDIESFIEPFRTHLEKDLDSVIAYAKDTYSKSDGTFNTAIGNFMADAIFKQANPIFNRRTGNNIDMVLLNHGGIRSIISKGDVTVRNMFELMPFENKIVIVSLKGQQMDSMVDYLCNSRRANPVSNLKLTIDNDFKPVEALINGKPIIKNNTYFVATNDYLYNRGDNMRFFRPNDSVFDLNYKIRNALIDYLKKIDTLKPIIDDRFTQIHTK